MPADDRAPGGRAGDASDCLRGARRRFPTPNAHERIHAATAAAVLAAGDYRQTSIEAICAIAEVSAATFEEHFPDKLAAALSAVETFADHVMADCHAAYAAAEDWPEAIWAVMAVATDWGASEPAFARLALVEIATAGAPAQELTDSLLDAFCLFLAPGYELDPQHRLPAGSLDEEIGAQVLALLRGQAQRESPQSLPKIVSALTHVALDPFIGRGATERLVVRQLAAEQE